MEKGVTAKGAGKEVERGQWRRVMRLSYEGGGRRMCKEEEKKEG